MTGIGTIFIVAATLLCHFHFSWMGFHPSDDGVVLANVRRLAEGQVPHLDFISIRPVFSSLLHLPVFWFGGDQVLWFSRLMFWFQLACIGWLWQGMILKMANLEIRIWQRMSLAWLLFVLCAHTFPMMVWSTVDGLFLAALGLPLCLAPDPKRQCLGYFLLGLSALTKQGFIFVPLVCLLITGRLRFLRFGFFAALPGLLYLFCLFALEAWTDAKLQLFAKQGFIGVGIASYWSSPFFTGWVLCGFVLGYGAFDMKNCWTAFCSAALLLTMTIVFSMSPALGPGRLNFTCFALFGLNLGLLGFFLFQKAGCRTFVPLSALSLCVAWASSLSRGYNKPALMLGVLVALPMVYALKALQARMSHGSFCTVLSWVFGLAALFATLAFEEGRNTFVYRDADRKGLTEPVGGHLAGAAGLYTNPNTLAFLKDLETLVKRHGDRPYAILPDLSAYWIRSPFPNPISADRPQTGELPTPALTGRIIGELEEKRGTLRVLIETVQSKILRDGFFSASDEEQSKNEVIRHVKKHWTLVDKSRCFAVYQ